MKKTIAIVFNNHLLFADSFAALIERLELFSDVHTLNDKIELRPFLIKHSKNIIYSQGIGDTSVSGN